MKMKFRSLYSGLGISIMGFGPFNALNFMFFYKYKEILKQHEVNDKLIKFSDITSLVLINQFLQNKFPSFHRVRAKSEKIYNWVKSKENCVISQRKRKQGF